MRAQAVERRWKGIAFAAALWIPLGAMAMARNDAAKEPVHPYDQWSAQSAATLSHLPGPDALVTAALLPSLAAAPDRQPLSLLDQASRQDPSAADIAALAMLKCEEMVGCDARARARHLQVLAPDNALAWLLDLHAAYQQQHAPDVTRVLQQMAQAGHFKTYETPLARRVREGLEKISPPPFENNPSPYRLSGDNARMLQARILVSFLPVPAYRDLLHACQPDDATFAQRKPACRQIAAELTQSSSLLAHLVGVELQRWTARDAADYRQALALGREADWLMSLRGTYCADQTHIVACLDADKRATGELDASRAIARQSGQPITPPSHWVDRRQQQRIRRDREKFHRHVGPAGTHADG